MLNGGLFQHRMACPWVADGEDGFWIQRATANILNKQS
jgi:hypothetical protein